MLGLGNRRNGKMLLSRVILVNLSLWPTIPVRCFSSHSVFLSWPLMFLLFRSWICRGRWSCRCCFNAERSHCCSCLGTVCYRKDDYCCWGQGRKGSSWFLFLISSISSCSFALKNSCSHLSTFLLSSQTTVHPFLPICTSVLSFHCLHHACFRSWCFRKWCSYYPQCNRPVTKSPSQCTRVFTIMMSSFKSIKAVPFSEAFWPRLVLFLSPLSDWRYWLNHWSDSEYCRKGNSERGVLTTRGGGSNMGLVYSFVIWHQ